MEKRLVGGVRVRVDFDKVAPFEVRSSDHKDSEVADLYLFADEARDLAETILAELED